MSKLIKRKITVNLTQKSKALPKSRPSVFERLGTKASTTKEYCHHWAQSGSCPFGKGCKYSATHTLISPSKQRAIKGVGGRHAKDVPKRAHTGEPEDWDQWDPDELEDADPDDLEKRRQELQRELEIQMTMENKRKKDKKVKRESSPSSDSSSSTSESSSSSDNSSSSSSSSTENRRKKLKKTKSKRASSSSSEDHSHKHRTKKRTARTAVVKLKKAKPTIKIKSPSPPPRKRSLTPPIKSSKLLVKKGESKSPRPISRSSDRKEKHRSSSPKTLKEKEREREREREKEREREREKEREREREREKEKERERERERAKERAKEREREHKRKDSRSPKRDSRATKSKKRDTPDSSHSRDRKLSPSRSKGSGSRREHKSPPPKDDRRSDKRDERARSRGALKDRPTTSDKNRKDVKRDSRDRERERERERERRLAREREAAREKEREEALARCQERQRERDRLKELAKKEEERRLRERERRREDRGLEKPSTERVERLLPLPDERVLPSRKGHSIDRERDERRDRRARSADRAHRKTPDRHDTRELEKERVYDRAYDRNYDRELERDYSAIPGRMRDERHLDTKEYDSPYDRARHDGRRYMEGVEMDHYNDNSRDEMRLDNREYVDDRQPRRDMWDERDIDRRFPRDEGRASALKNREWDPEYAGHENWDRCRRPMDWDGQGGPSWEGMEHNKHLPEEEWRGGHYNNRPGEGWPADDRRRWPNNQEWRERDRSRPRSATSHNRDPIVSEDSNLEARRKEPAVLPSRAVEPKPTETRPGEPRPVEPVRPVEIRSENSDSKSSSVAEPQEPVKEVVAVKRPADSPLEEPADVKKIKEAAPVLEDDLSEISDDADEILNAEEIENLAAEEAAAAESGEPEGLQDQNTSTAASTKSPSPPRSPQAQKDESIIDEGLLDFEEISEDELEEESRIKGIGDALGVDWASLVAESRPRTKPVSSAKRRWEAHNVLINVGVSVELTSEDYVKDIIREHKKLEKEAQNEEIKLKIKEEMVHIKQEKPEETNGIKQENLEELEETKIKVEAEEVNVSHPLASIQIANREKSAVRKALFSSVGPFRRALSARRDLTLRRHLCNLPVNDTYVEAPKIHDPELLSIATQLFERSL